MMKHRSALYAPLMLSWILAGCISKDYHGTATAPETVPPPLPETTAAQTAAYAEPPTPENAAIPSEPASAAVIPSLLASPEDIGLYDTDGEGRTYHFIYDGESYQAIYTPDNWKIIDSYRIRSADDICIICAALMEEHPIHSADYESYRTAEDMAYEWLQHNLAYELLPEDSAWRISTKDVDINPEDQGKNMYDLYLDRIGREE